MNSLRTTELSGIKPSIGAAGSSAASWLDAPGRLIKPARSNAR